MKHTFIEFLSFLGMTAGLFIASWAIAKYATVAYIVLTVILLMIIGACVLMYRKKK